MPNCAICNKHVVSGLVVHDDCLAKQKELHQENAMLKSAIEDAGLSVGEIIDLLDALADGWILTKPNKYICPICQNEEHLVDAKYCKICGAKIKCYESHCD